jgi:hypothetical protein
MQSQDVVSLDEKMLAATTGVSGEEQGLHTRWRDRLTDEQGRAVDISTPLFELCGFPFFIPLSELCG